MHKNKTADLERDVWPLWRSFGRVMAAFAIVFIVSATLPAK